MATDDNLNRRDALKVFASAAGVAAVPSAVVAQTAPTDGGAPSGGITLPPSAQQENPYMGAPVTLSKAPNGAIANKKVLDGIEKVAWLRPTIENPAEGVWVLGGYGTAPMTIIDTDEGPSPSIPETASTMARSCLRLFVHSARSR